MLSGQLRSYSLKIVIFCATSLCAMKNFEQTVETLLVKLNSIGNPALYSMQYAITHHNFEQLNTLFKKNYHLACLHKHYLLSKTVIKAAIVCNSPCNHCWCESMHDIQQSPPLDYHHRDAHAIKALISILPDTP